MLRYFLLLLVFYHGGAIADDIVPTNQVVNSENHEEYGVYLIVGDSGLGCDGVDDVYVVFPETFQGATSRSARVSLKKDNQLQLELSSVVINLDDYMNIRPFHGIALCLDASLLGDIEVAIAYGKGEFIISILKVKDFDKFDQYISK